MPAQKHRAQHSRLCQAVCEVEHVVLIVVRLWQLVIKLLVLQ